MTNKYFLSALLIIFIAACSSREVKTDPSADSIIQMEQDTYHQVSSSYHTQINPNWTNLEELNGVWTTLERDEKGYVVYDPCDGVTPRIKVDHNNITVYHRLDGRNTFHVEKAEMVSDHEIKLYVRDVDNEETKGVFQSKIVDAERKLVLWEFTVSWPPYQGGRTDYRWVTTRKELEHTFRQVANPCPGKLVKEVTFLPIEF